MHVFTYLSTALGSHRRRQKLAWAQATLHTEGDGGGDGALQVLLPYDVISLVAALVPNATRVVTMREAEVQGVSSLLEPADLLDWIDTQLRSKELPPGVWPFGEWLCK